MRESSVIDPSACFDLQRALQGRAVVVKLGGSVSGEDTLPADAVYLQSLGVHVTLVHGGGPLITAWLERIGKATHFVHGLRYTDEETLDVVRMVLSGLVNGEIVARIGHAGGRCIGLTGADNSLLVAEVGDPAVGLVGEIRAVNPSLVHDLQRMGYIVVISPVAIDGNGGFLNVNADTAAAEIAVALRAERLVFLTDVDGVKTADGEVVRRMVPQEARRLIERGDITGGMIPKVEACVRALQGAAGAQIVNGRRPHALLEALAAPGRSGTVLVAGAPSQR